ncbi:MAG: ribokinase [Alphaproteobacteria bacterium]|nr:MAG: ribokinase [Alphaproteobacteria bacterium]
MSNVWVLGSINADLVVVSDRFPTKGETVLGKTFSQNPGGKGANQAVAAARLGANVFLIGAVGQDAQGVELRKFLEDQGVCVDNVCEKTNFATGVALIAVAEKDNMIIVVPGANMAITPASLENLDIKKGDICVAQMEVPSDVIQAFFLKARKLGATSILNLSPASLQAADIIKSADILILNETELGLLVSKRLEEFASLDQLSAHVSDLNILPQQTLILTLGKRGAVSYNGSSPEYCEVPAVKIDAVIDTTGAGDCFCGAFACFMSQGVTIEEALHSANCAASLSVQKFGAASSMPTISELRRHILGAEQ